MGSSDDHDYLTTDDPLHVQRYILRAAKAYLCIVCWVGICAGLLLYGPPALNVPTSPGPLGVVGIVEAGFGVVLSAGTATFLTIVLAFCMFAANDWRRNRSVEQQDDTDATNPAGGE